MIIKNIIENKWSWANENTVQLIKLDTKTCELYEVYDDMYIV